MIVISNLYKQKSLAFNLRKQGFVCVTVKFWFRKILCRYILINYNSPNFLIDSLKTKHNTTKNAVLIAERH